jgi:predicted Fe-Mo cluster-binding NifX family protein
MTRICVPTEGSGGLDAPVGEHFGRVPSYTIFDTETDQVTVVANTSEHLGGRGLPAEILSDSHIDVLACHGAGRRALAMFAEKGVEVCIGAQGTAREAIAAWKSGTLSGATEADACQQHAFHDSGKHDA